MPNTLLSLLSSLLFAVLASGIVQCSETGTFSATDLIVCRLLNRSDGTELVSRLEVEFRTSHANDSALIGLRNANGEQLTVLVANEAQLTLRLAWIPGGNGSGYDEADQAVVDGGDQFQLATLDLTLESPNVGVGEWRRIAVALDNGGAVLLDDSQVGHLPTNFTTRFAWDGTAEVVVGGDFRGCLANVSLDGVAWVPLHSESELLNRTDSSSSSLAVNASVSRLPGGGPGCRQDPCPCLPNGICVYQRWNLLLGCNCSRGYQGLRCESEWDTCLHLDASSECLNGGRCENLPGPQAHRCSCPPDRRYVGSRCQSFNHCSVSITCQNGANCTLTGDPESPSEVDYRCACTHGFTGRNCTELVTQPEEAGVSIALIVGVTVGVIAVLLLLIAALVATKVIRDRRKDSGAYRPSQRETAVNSNINEVYADQVIIGMSQVMRPPKDERLI